MTREKKKQFYMQSIKILIRISSLVRLSFIWKFQGESEVNLCRTTVERITKRMTTPFSHAHVSFVSRTARRRSQSLTIPDAYNENTVEQSIGHVSLSPKISTMYYFSQIILETVFDTTTTWTTKSTEEAWWTQRESTRKGRSFTYSRDSNSGNK